MELPPILARGTAFRTDIPGRLDRLPWSRWHWRVVLALGITSSLDGLEASLIANIAAVLTQRDTLALDVAQVSRDGPADFALRGHFDEAEAARRRLARAQCFASYWDLYFLSQSLP